MKKLLFQKLFHLNSRLAAVLWTIFITLSFWFVIFVFSNSTLDFFAEQGIISQLTFITKDIDTVRYLLSSIFQGLAALLALVISIMFVVAQFVASHYSSRFIKYLVREKWFVWNISFFIIVLVINLILLSFVSKITVQMIPAVILLIDMVLSVGAVIVIMNLAFSFTRAMDPHNIARRLLKNLELRFADKDFFNDRRKAADSEVMILVEAFVIKSVKVGDSDIARRMIGSLLGEIVKKYLTVVSYKNLVAYVTPFIKKIAIIAAHERDEAVLKQIIAECEELEKSTPFPKLTQQVGMFDVSLGSLIANVGEIAVNNKLTDSLVDVLVAISRLAEIVIPQISVDSENSEFRIRPALREGAKFPKNNPEHYQNRHVFEQVEKVYVKSFSSLASLAIGEGLEEQASSAIRWMSHTVYPIIKLDGARQEAKLDLLRSIAFEYDNLARAALDKRVNVFEEIGGGIETFTREAGNVDDFILKYSTKTMSDIIQQMLEKDIFLNSIRRVFWDFSLLSRWFQEPETKGANDVIYNFISTCDNLVKSIDKKLKDGHNPALFDLRNQIAEELLGLRRTRPNSLNRKTTAMLDKLLKKWPKKFIERIDNKYGAKRRRDKQLSA